MADLPKKMADIYLNTCLTNNKRERERESNFGRKLDFSENNFEEFMKNLRK